MSNVLSFGVSLLRTLIWTHQTDPGLKLLTVAPQTGCGELFRKVNSALWWTNTVKSGGTIHKDSVSSDL